MTEQVKSAAATAAVIIVITTVLAFANTLWRQHDQFARGEAARAAGDLTRAVAGYESAIHMYTPGSGTVEQAAARLWEIGEQAERAGDRPKALMAYQAIRSSFYAARWLVTPGREWIEKSEAKIAALEASSAEAPAAGNIQ